MDGYSKPATLARYNYCKLRFSWDLASVQTPGRIDTFVHMEHDNLLRLGDLCGLVFLPCGGFDLGDIQAASGCGGCNIVGLWKWCT